MLEDGMQVVVGEIMPEWECARDLMSPYSDLVCGGEKVPLESNWPVVEEIGELSMLESLHTVAESCGCGATRAILPVRISLAEKSRGQPVTPDKARLQSHKREHPDGQGARATLRCRQVKGGRVTRVAGPVPIEIRLRGGLCRAEPAVAYRTPLRAHCSAASIREVSPSNWSLLCFLLVNPGLQIQQLTNF